MEREVEQATLSVSREGGATVLRVRSTGQKAWEVLDVAVRLSDADMAWLRERLK